MVQQFRIFQKLLILIFLLFIGILIYVLIYAHIKKSGVTGLSMSHIQEMRMGQNKGQVEEASQ